MMVTVNNRQTKKAGFRGTTMSLFSQESVHLRQSYCTQKSQNCIKFYFFEEFFTYIHVPS